MNTAAISGARAASREMAGARLGLLWVGFVAGCASLQSPPRDVRQWRPPAPQATHYTTEATGDPALASGRPSLSLATAIETTTRLQGASLRGDGRLAQLAAFAAQELQAGQPPPSAAILEEVAQQLGLPDGAPELLVLTLPRGETSTALAQALGPRLSGRSFTHYGAALLAQRPANLLVIALCERRLQLDDVPRSSALSPPIRVHGHLLEGYSNPRVDLMAASGARKLLPAGAGPDFDVELPTLRPGRYRVELLGDAALGTQVLAKLAVYVGAPAPSSVTLPSVRRARDLGKERAELLTMLNAERTRAGLPPLAADPVLDELATRHSIDMRDHAFVGHDSASTGTPKARVARASVGSGLVLENIVRGQDAAGLHAAVLAQPDLRTSLLRPEVTNVGLGLAELSQGDGSFLLLTELLVQVVRPVDASVAEPRLLDLLNQTRAKRGAPTLTLSPELAAVARQAAQSFVSDAAATEQAVVDEANKNLQHLSVAYRRVATVLAVVRDVDQAATLEAALDRDARVAGIGIAQGDRGGNAGQVLAVVVVLAWPKPGSP